MEIPVLHSIFTMIVNAVASILAGVRCCVSGRR
jgi:hypothetical protein